MGKIIELSGICKRYNTRGGTVNALDNIKLDIEKGSFTSVIGQSGSGKSTLMNILGCLDKADKGEYLLDGISVAGMSERKLSFIRNNMIGFIFQSFNLIPTLTAQENVELPLIYRGIRKSERKELSHRALDMVGLEKRRLHKPNELSGGQQQRVAIARAIAASPKLILADEPTGNLDSSSGNDIMAILSGLHKAGSTMILITHDNDIAAMAENCIKISDGRICYDN